MEIKSKFWMLVGELFLILFAVALFFPVFFTILTSIKEPVDAFCTPPKWIFNPTVRHHIYMWTQAKFGKYLLNTLIIALGTVAISVPLGSLAAYLLARYRTPGNRALLFFLLAVRMFPRMLLVVPFFLIAKALGLYDTHAVVILIMVAFNQPFTIWLMRGFFLEIPVELEEAAEIDGCSRVQAFFRVVLPVARPGLVSAMLFCLLLAYNEFLIPFILTGPHAKPLPVLVAEYGTEKIEYWSISTAAAIEAMAPIIIFMLIVQRHIIRGLTFGAIKG